MDRVKNIAKGGIKKFSKWAVEKPKPTGISNIASPYNEPNVAKGKITGNVIEQTAKALGKSVSEMWIKPSAASIKMAGQAIGKGAGRLAYGEIAKRPTSVKSNVKRKK